MTVADLIRSNARRLGVDLRHIDDRELGARLAAMPADLCDPMDAVCWLAYGALGPPRAPYRPRDMVGA